MRLSWQWTLFIILKVTFSVLLAPFAAADEATLALARNAFSRVYVEARDGNLDFFNRAIHLDSLENTILDPTGRPNPSVLQRSALIATEAVVQRNSSEPKTFNQARVGHVVLYQGEKRPFSVLILPGFTFGPERYHEQMQELYGLGHNVLAVAWDGFSRFQDRHTRVRYGNWLQQAEQALLRAQELGDQVIIMGESMGGIFAAHLARKTESRVAGMILVEPAFRLDPGIEFLACTFRGVISDLRGSFIQAQFFGDRENPISPRLGCEVANAGRNLFPGIRVRRAHREPHRGRRRNRPPPATVQVFGAETWLITVPNVATLFQYTSDDSVVDKDVIGFIGRSLKILNRENVTVNDEAADTGQGVRTTERVRHSQTLERLWVPQLNVTGFQGVENSWLLQARSAAEQRFHRLSNVDYEILSRVDELLSVSRQQFRSTLSRAILAAIERSNSVNQSTIDSALVSLEPEGLRIFAQLVTQSRRSAFSATELESLRKYFSGPAFEPLGIRRCMDCAYTGLLKNWLEVTLRFSQEESLELLLWATRPADDPTSLFGFVAFWELYSEALRVPADLKDSPLMLRLFERYEKTFQSWYSNPTEANCRLISNAAIRNARDQRPIVGQMRLVQWFLQHSQELRICGENSVEPIFSVAPQNQLGNLVIRLSASENRQGAIRAIHSFSLRASNEAVATPSNLQAFSTAFRQICRRGWPFLYEIEYVRRALAAGLLIPEEIRTCARANGVIVQAWMLRILLEEANNRRDINARSLIHELLVEAQTTRPVGMGTLWNRADAFVNLYAYSFKASPEVREHIVQAGVGLLRDVEFAKAAISAGRIEMCVDNPLPSEILEVLRSHEGDLDYLQTARYSCPVILSSAQLP